MADGSQINIENSKSSDLLDYQGEINSGSLFDHFKLWVKKQRFIPQDLSDDFLLQFQKNRSIEEATEKLGKYFYIRQENARLFGNRDPTNPINLKIFKTLYVLPIPGVTEDNKKIIVTGLIDGNPINYHPFYHVKAVALILDLLLWNNELADYIIVVDGKSFKSPYSLVNVGGEFEKDVKEFQENFPYEMIGFYVLYPPDYVGNVMEMREGIWMNLFHNRQELREKLPPDLLPLEFGGNLGHLEDLLEQWNQRLASSRDFFIDFEAKMANDYRRRQCHLRETSKGPFWVHQLKLVEDEYEYKTGYYKKFKSKAPSSSKSKRWYPIRPSFLDPLKELRKLAKQEEKESEISAPSVKKTREKSKIHSNSQIPCVAILFDF